MSATAGGLVIVPVLVLRFQIWLPKRKKEGEGVSWAQRWEALSGQQSQMYFLKPDLLGPSLGRRALGLLLAQSTKQKQDPLMAPCSAFILKAPVLRILRKGGNVDCSLSRVIKVKRPLSLCKAQSEKLASEPKDVAFCTET